MRPVGKCAHCGADTFLGSLVIGPGLLGSQPVYCATEGCVAAAFSEGLGAWLPIATAPHDGTMVLVNDTTPGYTPWVAASYLDGEEWSGWVYDDATTADSNPLGPNPTHWLPVPPLSA
ncbi:MAG: hypothetical protein ACK50K_06045 [Betaproteobacteria bacterium]|jgi:hypothetical protein